MSQRKVEKSIMAEVLRLHALSSRLPVERFWIDAKTGRVSNREFSGQYGVLNDLMHLCDQLESGRAGG